MAKQRPCGNCPWTQKGQPLITEVQRKANVGDAWFCCHVNMGTCHGAENVKQSKINKNGKSK